MSVHLDHQFLMLTFKKAISAYVMMYHAGGQRLRDAETEEMIENMQSKLVELEQENGMLKNKVLVLKYSGYFSPM